MSRDGLAHALTTRTRQTREGPIVSPLNVRAATENRDSLAKIIYSKMFDWLVAAINAAIGEDKVGFRGFAGGRGADLGGVATGLS